MFTRSLAAAAAGLLLAAAPCAAQDLIPKAPPQERAVVITNAAIHTVSGDVIGNGTIWFQDGVIQAIGAPGARIRLPRDAERIDASGKHVYPGLISANTGLGLVEVNSVRATVDMAEVGGVTPEVRAAVAVNPDSTLIPVARRNGVLVAGVTPMGGPIPGRASVIRLDGWTWETMAIEDDAGLVVNWPRLRPISAWWMDQSEEEQRKEAQENLERIKEAFRAARAYLEAKEADPSIKTDIRWEAMRGVLSGEKPVFIAAQEYEQIQSAVSWATDQGLNPVIVGGRDSHLLTDFLKAHDVPVVITATHRTPRRRDSAYNEPFRLPALLEQAGVQWALASSGGGFGAANERNLPYQAGTAVAHGLSREAAIRGITLAPARILGVDDRLGSLEEGKAATLIVTTGDPLEFTTDVELAFIDGRRVDLRSKQTELRDKYREKYRQLDLIEKDE